MALSLTCVLHPAGLPLSCSLRPPALLVLPLNLSHAPRFLPRSLRRCSSPSALRPLAAVNGDLSSTSTATVAPAGEIDGDILSGEWPENFSILNFEDLCKHYEPSLFKEEAQPHTFLADVMSSVIYSATPDQLLEEIDHFFLSVSGIPVVNNELKCLGVLSKKDRAKASKGLQSTVGEVMSSPPISLSADKTVNDAAILMLKNKVHRIPIVNEANQVVGIVTRTDIFRALEGEP